MKFEDCRKIMLQYIKAREAMRQLMDKCQKCDEKCCHCSECPMLVDGQCAFPDNL